MNKLTLLVITLFLMSCNSNDGVVNTNVSPIGNEELIDATSYANWNYFTFTDSTLQQVTPWILGDTDSSLNWDIAFQRNHIKTNSGTSGIGEAGAHMDSSAVWNGSAFNNFSEDVFDYNFSKDTLVNTFYNLQTHTFTEGSTNPILDTWGIIDTLNNYTMNISNSRYIVRSADGNSFYKLWVYDYYSEDNQSGNVSLIFDIVN